ncbi:hypothetical protein FOCC_FOCC016844, partial [Frankliniella occidentalis]
MPRVPMQPRNLFAGRTHDPPGPGPPSGYDQGGYNQQQQHDPSWPSPARPQSAEYYGSYGDYYHTPGYQPQYYGHVSCTPQSPYPYQDSGYGYWNGDQGYGGATPAHSEKSGSYGSTPGQDYNGHYGYDYSLYVAGSEASWQYRTPQTGDWREPLKEVPSNLSRTGVQQYGDPSAWSTHGTQPRPPLYARAPQPPPPPPETRPPRYAPAPQPCPPPMCPPPYSPPRLAPRAQPIRARTDSSLPPVQPWPLPPRDVHPADRAADRATRAPEAT